MFDSEVVVGLFVGVTAVDLVDFELLSESLLFLEGNMDGDIRSSVSTIARSSSVLSPSIFGGVDVSIGTGVRALDGAGVGCRAVAPGVAGLLPGIVTSWIVFISVRSRTSLSTSLLPMEAGVNETFWASSLVMKLVRMPVAVSPSLNKRTRTFLFNRGFKVSKSLNGVVGAGF